MCRLALCQTTSHMHIKALILSGGLVLVAVGASLHGTYLLHSEERSRCAYIKCSQNLAARALNQRNTTCIALNSSIFSRCFLTCPSTPQQPHNRWTLSCSDRQPPALAMALAHASTVMHGHCAKAVTTAPAAVRPAHRTVAPVSAPCFSGRVDVEHFPGLKFVQHTRSVRARVAASEPLARPSPNQLEKHQSSKYQPARHEEVYSSEM